MRTLILFTFLFAVSCSRSEKKVSPVRKNIIETVYASGKIIPENEYRLFALSNGVIQQKLVREGDTVSSGQIIYRIDSEAPEARFDAAKSMVQNSQANVSPQSRILNDLKLAYESAEVKFRNDSLNYFRLKNLYDQNAASRSAVDNAYTVYSISLNQKKSATEKYYAMQSELNVALQNAKSQLAAASYDLGNYSIKSEANGTVYQLLKETGEAVRAGEVVALLGETAGRVIRLAIDQQDIDKIKPGQEVLLKTDVSGNKIFHGTVKRIYPVMNEVDQTFRVDAAFNDAITLPFVHSSVEANIIIQRKNNALIIPRAAMTADDSVRVKRDGETKNIFVKTGIRTLEEVEILEGLDESSTIIVTESK